MSIDDSTERAAVAGARRYAAMARLLAAVAPLGIGACSGVSVGVNAPPAAPAGFAFAATAVSASTSDSTSTAQSGVLSFALTIAAADGGAVPQLSPTWSGTAIKSVGVTLVPSAAGAPSYQGTLTVAFWPGATLGAGQYTGTVKLTACVPQGTTTCGNPMSASIAATLSVSGGTRPSTTLAATPAQLDVESPVTSSAAVIGSFQVSLSQPSPPIYVSLVQPSAAWISSVSYQSSGSQAGTVSLTLLPAAQMTVGIHPGTATLNVCLDAQCLRPLQNSPLTVPVTYRAIPLAQLSRWFQGGFSGKKVVVWGNSTVSNAVYYFQQFDTYTLPGGPLDGLNPANVFNYGNNGASLAALLAGEGPYPVAAVIAAQPDLLIMRGPLINDVRLGTTDLAQAEQLLVEALDQITTGSPNTDILLVTENSFLTTNVDDLNFVQPNSAAQAYTDILHAAPLAMAGRYPHVAVYDIMALEYGLVCQASSPLMLNQIHPDQAGQLQEAGLDVQVVGLPLLAN